jgi:hypothetical protein
MSSGILNRDFVYGSDENQTDWHGLTVYKPELTSALFPTIVEEALQTSSGKTIPFKILVSSDDGLPCGTPFNPGSFGYILPQRAWDMVGGALEGTHYTVKRMGMLWDRSFWFVSIELDELKALSLDGEMFRLNFSGGLDGQDSPQGELSHILAVCWNTISASRASKEWLFKVRQTSKSGDRLAEAQAEVAKAVGMAKIFNETMNKLRNTKCTVDQAQNAYAGEVFARGGNFGSALAKDGTKKENRARNTVDELVSLFSSGLGNKGETVADLLNGYTQMFTRGRLVTTKKPLALLKSSEFGTNSDRKADFFNTVSDRGSFKKLIEQGKVALATN